jgi:hypothetical protein
MTLKHTLTTRIRDIRSHGTVASVTPTRTQTRKYTPTQAQIDRIQAHNGDKGGTNTANALSPHDPPFHFPHPRLCRHTALHLASHGVTLPRAFMARLEQGVWRILIVELAFRLEA